MRDGGVVVMVMPNNPYRCPPGPYERACMIAHYLKTKKPKSKLIILDPKKSFSKQPVFTEAFEKYYKDIVELNLTNEIDDFAVVSVDAKTKEIVTKAGKKVKADVANIIPQQRAGEIANKAGAAEGDWCPVDPENFSAKKVEDVYVLGDASIAAEMPKSAFSANSQAKVVAADILAELDQEGKVPGALPQHLLVAAGARRLRQGRRQLCAEGRQARSVRLVRLAAGRDGRGAQAELQPRASAWYDSIISEMFAKPASPAPRRRADRCQA